MTGINEIYRKQKNEKKIEESKVGSSKRTTELINF
jgi:hypothetical protein